MKKFDISKIKQSIKGSAANDKSFKFGGYSVFSGIIVLLIAVFAVLAVESLSSRYTKVDMTSGDLYSISQETENIVKALDKDVQIYFIAQSGSEDQLIQNMLERYDDLSDKITVTVKDPAVNPNFASQYTSGNVSLNSVIVECGDKSRYISYEEMYSVETDYQTYTQTSEFNAESNITGAIDYVSGDSFPKIYMTTGHGESELSSSIAELVKKSNVDSESISLLTAESVPEDAACVMIYEPTADISENEKNLLLNYLKGGGNLIVMGGYSVETGADFPNLNALMQNYGVTSENAMVFEGDDSKCLRGYNYYLVPDMASHTITDPLLEARYNILLPMAKPIKLTETKPSTTVISQIITTSNEAYAKTDVQTIEREEGDIIGQFTVGAAITDTTDNGDAHILWITANQFLDEQVNMSVSGGNQDLFLNAVNWMSDREESIAIHPKNLSAEYLTVSSSASAVWSIIFVFIIPAAVLAFGIYVWIRRKSR